MDSFLWFCKAFLFSRRILAQAFEPKTIKWETLGLWPLQASNGFFPYNDFCGDMFLKICGTIDIFRPYIMIQILFFHHACSHLLERSILALCNTILLWCVGYIMLHLDAKFLTNIIKTIIHILLSIFSPKNLDLIPTCILNQRFTNFESLKNFIF